MTLTNKAKIALKTIVDHADNVNENKMAGNVVFLPEDLLEMATDLMTDIRHFCDRHDIRFNELSDISYQHYLKERQDVGKTSN